MITQTRQNGLSHPLFAGYLPLQNRDEAFIWGWSISFLHFFARIAFKRNPHSPESWKRKHETWIRAATKHKTRAKGSLRDVGDRLGPGYGLRLHRPVTMVCLANRICIWNAATCLQQPTRPGSETCVENFQIFNRWTTPLRELCQTLLYLERKKGKGKYPKVYYIVFRAPR